MPSLSCPQCGDKLSKLAEYREFASGLHRVYSCPNCCSVWSDRWGKELRPESREKWEERCGRGDGDGDELRDPRPSGYCFSDGVQTRHQLPNGMFLCPESVRDWIERGWLDSAELFTESFFKDNPRWSPQADEKGVVRPVEVSRKR